MSQFGLIFFAQTTPTPTSGLSSLPANAQYFLMAIAIAAIALTVFRPKFKKRGDPLSRPESAASLSQQRGVERQMQNLLVDLSEMSRQITAQLDTRSLKLELLIKEADEKIARMETLASRPNPDGQSTNGNGPYGFGTEVQPAGLPPRPVETSNLAPAPEIDGRHLTIYALADEGTSVRDIASKLDRPTGEIELILALRPRR